MLILINGKRKKKKAFKAEQSVDPNSKNPDNSKLLKVSGKNIWNNTSHSSTTFDNKQCGEVGPARF